MYTTTTPQAPKPLPPASPRWVSLERPLSTSLCTPAVRMLVVEVAINDDGTTDHEVFPVLALRSAVSRTYTRQRHGENFLREDGTEQDLLKDKWTLEYQNERISAVIYDPAEERLSGYDEEFRQGCNTVSRLVVCPWPAAEDEERLRPIIAQLAAAAVKKMKRK